LAKLKTIDHGRVFLEKSLRENTGEVNSSPKIICHDVFNLAKNTLIQREFVKIS
jgi:hypothetical protein